MFTKLFCTAALALSSSVTLVACATPPTDIDLSLDKTTAAGTYRVVLVPPSQPPAINHMHSRQVKLATPDGTPVHRASFVVGGGMPQHGHGLPTQPRVTREVGDGSTCSKA